MRNTTKLKHLLRDYDISLSLCDGMLSAVITSKATGTSHVVEATSWTLLMQKALTETKKYSHILNEKKEGLQEL